MIRKWTVDMLCKLQINNSDRISLHLSRRQERWNRSDQDWNSRSRVPVPPLADRILLTALNPKNLCTIPLPLRTPKSCRISSDISGLIQDPIRFSGRINHPEVSFMTVYSINTNLEMGATIMTSFRKELRECNQKELVTPISRFGSYFTTFS